MIKERVLVSVLRFDARAHERLAECSQNIQRLLEREAASASLPHISLIPTDMADEQELLHRLGIVARSMPPFDVIYSYLGWFSGGVLFLGITPTQALLSLHHECFRLSSPSPATPWIDLYGPGNWVPHCTIATSVPENQRGDVISEILRAESFPTILRCSSIELLCMSQGQTRSLGSAEFAA